MPSEPRTMFCRCGERLDPEKYDLDDDGSPVCSDCHERSEFEPGDEVYLLVSFPGSIIRNLLGTLILIDENGDAFIETKFGPMVGRADTLESA